MNGEDGGAVGREVDIVVGWCGYCCWQLLQIEDGT